MSIILTRNGEKEQKLLSLNSAQANMVKGQYNAFNRSMENMDKVYHGEYMQGNALTVPKDAWGQWATTGIEVQRDVLAVFSSLSGVSRGVDLATMVDYFQTISDSSDDVSVTIDGRGKAKTDQPVINYHGTPLPIFENNCSFGWRQMMTIRKAGGNLEGASMNNKIRHIAEKLEDMTLNGLDIDVGGAKVYGMLNHPQRNTRSTGVTLNGATGAEWESEVKATLKLLHGDNFRNSITLYLNWDDYFYASSTEYSTQYAGKSILQRVMEIAGVEAIVPASKVPANTVIGLVRRSEVVEMLNGMPIVTRPKNRLNPEDDYVFHTMAAQAIQLKFDDENQMGLAVSS